MENKKGKKAYLGYKWQKRKYGKAKEGKSKEKGKERRQSKRGREKIKNLEKTRCQVHIGLTIKVFKIMEKENDVSRTF
jgi:hypothetical protein